MIINNTPSNEAVISNVGEVGEFRIRNSAKAFKILSDGLYANKIRAIIRELSCNAVDSHTAAGNENTPFDVHLPNHIEPWFSIRDYGVGLSHDQVVNIYTTYFESTKTDSNAFIGALGLGSKSPFSYTDNFTVTAIRNGRRGIYTAFINDQGVPSIALMMESQTEEPNGVEVKFSVNDRWDYERFAHEASQVYQYFKLQPVVSGRANFEVRAISYETRDIIPGVHSCVGTSHSVAVMGNIAYPIQVPDSDKSLGSLKDLLRCGLELHFNIGELDFQASREGLSYIAQTMNAIKKKLEQLNQQLVVYITTEANKIENLWERAFFLEARAGLSLWREAVKCYVAATNLPTYNATNSLYHSTTTFKFNVDELAKKFNISINAFDVMRNKENAKPIKVRADYRKKADGTDERFEYWPINVNQYINFVINDLKTGVQQRARRFYRDNRASQKLEHVHVYVLSPANKTAAMDVKGFFDAICQPPESCKKIASSFPTADRKSYVAKNVSIMQLEERGFGNWERSRQMVWRSAGNAEDFDDNTTYYYVPITGHKFESQYNYSDIGQLYKELVDSRLGLLPGTIYGIRKSDIAWVEDSDNWINLETYIAENIEEKLKEHKMKIVRASLADINYAGFNNSEIISELAETSLFRKAVTALSKQTKFHGNVYAVESLMQHFAMGQYSKDIEVLSDKYKKLIANVNARYPLLTSLRYGAERSAVVHYINLIDSTKA